MITPFERIAALAAVFLPARAGRLMSLVATPWSAGALSYATALSLRPREERLAALADALAGSPAGASASRGAGLTRLASLRTREPAAPTAPRPLAGVAASGSAPRAAILPRHEP